MYNNYEAILWYSENGKLNYKTFDTWDDALSEAKTMDAHGILIDAIQERYEYEGEIIYKEYSYNKGE